MTSDRATAADDWIDRVGRLGRVDLAAIAIVVISTLLRLPAVFTSFFWQPDLAHLTEARSDRIGGSQLVHADGTGPLAAATTWLVSRLGAWTYVPAGLLLLLLEAVASALLWLALRRLYGARPAALVPLGVAALTPASVAALTWLTGGLLVVLPQVCLSLGVLGLLGFAASRGELRTWWALAVLLAHVACVLSGAMGLLFLPALVLVRFAIGLSAVRDAARLPSRGSVLVFWIPQVVVSAGAFALYLGATDVSSAAVSPSWWRVFLPSLIGAPFSNRGATESAYPYTPAGWSWAVVAVLLVLLLASVVVGRLRSGLVWLCAVLLVAGATLVVAGWPTSVGTAYDAAELTAVLPVALLIVSLAFTRRRPTNSARDQRRRSRALAPVLAVPVLLTLVVALPMNVVFGDTFSHLDAASYARHLHAGLKADRSRSLRNAALPDSVAADTDLRGLFTAMGERPVLDQPSAQLWVVDDSGAVVSGRLRDATVTQGPRRKCGWLVDGNPTRVLASADGAAPVIRLDYYSGSDGLLTVTRAGTTQSAAVNDRLGSTYVTLPGVPGPVTVRFEEADGPMCLVKVLEGEPWPAG
ncbi:MAG: hypothetical protein ACR2K3_11135 [Nocardioides sp.]